MKSGGAGRIRVVHLTDPGCQIAFAAEPVRLRLAALYGDALEWRNRMVVLSDDPARLAAETSPGRQARGYARWAARSGMPFDTAERPRLAVTVDACRAVVAARLRAPAHEEALLRRLRVRGMGGGLLDDPALIAAAAAEAGIDPDALTGWTREPAVDAALRADMALARSPSPVGRALDHKLAGPPGERRYTAPTYLFVARDGRTLEAPGLQPIEALEAMVANLDPEIPRLPLPASVEDALAWAAMPLATAEVAALTGLDRDKARRRLERAGAHEDPVGDEAWWSAAEVGARA